MRTLAFSKEGPHQKSHSSSGAVLLSLAAVLALLAPPSSAGEQTQFPWIGIYLFEEQGPRTGNGAGPAMTLRYKLAVVSQGKNLVGNLDLDGYQTCYRINCRIKTDDPGRLKVYLWNYRKGNGLQPYSKGSHLFS